MFNRHGVDKDERALAIEREESKRLRKDRDDERAILERNFYRRLAECPEGQELSAVRKAQDRQSMTEALADVPGPVVADRLSNDKAMKLN